MSFVVPLKPNCAGEGSGVHCPSPEAQSPPTLMPPYNPVHVESDDNRGLAPKSAASALAVAPRWANPRLAIAASDPTTAFFIPTLFRLLAQPCRRRSPTREFYRIYVAGGGLSGRLARKRNRAAGPCPAAL